MAELRHAASSLFSTAVFRPILAGDASTRGDALIQRLRADLDLSMAATNLEVVHGAYGIIRSAYRSEYYYRNLLTSKLFVGRHRASARSVMLNELHIDTSIADCVLVNGEGTVFEIKTQFDRPEKLGRQVGNYYKAFGTVVVVADESDADRYLNYLAETGVGLWTVGRREQLSITKRAVPRNDSLHSPTMFNVLRAVEAAAALKEWFGPLPDIPNGRRHREYLALAEQIPAEAFQALMRKQLKTRVFRGERGLLVCDDLVPLRSLMLQLSPSAAEQENLWRWLHRRA